MHDGFRRRRHVDVGGKTPDLCHVDLVPRLDPVEERIFEILRGHFRAVVEFDVVAEVERQAQAVRRQVPGGDQLRNQLEVRRLIERLVEHQLVDRLRVGNGALLGVP
jgi:hypothetical protein